MLKKHEKTPAEKLDRPAIQQDNNYKEFMTLITDGGLRYAVASQNKDGSNGNNNYRKKVEGGMERNVIVVGAGMSGLSAAYELAQIGHQVTILEAQSRVGGRAKTFRQGFADGLHCEGGAMRLPPNHYLTKHYINLFDVKTRPFVNYNKRGYVYMYGQKVRIEEFEKSNKFYTDIWWPGWDDRYSAVLKDELKITGIRLKKIARDTCIVYWSKMQESI